MRFLKGMLGQVLFILSTLLAVLANKCAADEPVQDAVVPPVVAQEQVPVEHTGPTDPKELEAFVDGIMAAEMCDKHIAGATFVFVKDNRPFFAKGYGYADVAARKTVDPNETMFRIGSVSKLFTWTAVMQLVEQGKLDLDADINVYLKDFQVPATFPEHVSLKHLLTHTPGFEDRVIGLFGRGPSDTPLGKLLATGLPARVRKPGELASYSNHGTAIAGYIVQEVSGMPWEEYIEQKILEPLGMNHTTVRQPAQDKLPPEMSKGYKYERGKYVSQGFEYVPPAPAGSISASAGDMAKFMIAHLQDGTYESKRILGDETARKMRSLLFTHDPRIEGLAYGFMRMKFGDEQIVEHGGDTFAFHSFFVMLPERNSGFFVSYNTTTAGSARETLLKALMNRYYPSTAVAEQPVAAKDFSHRAQSYTGQYGAIRNSYSTLAKIGALFSVANVSVDDDQLVLSASQADNTMRFVEVEPALFQELDGERKLVFRQSGENPATHLFLSSAPVAFVRLPWYETPAFSLSLIAACVAVFVSAVIGWPLGAFIARGNPATRRTRGSNLASWLGWITSLAILVILGLAMIPFSNPEEITYGVPALLQGLLWSNLLIVALVVALLACTIAAWRNGYWRTSARLHYTCVLLAGVAFVWFLSHWNLLGVSA